MTAYAKHNDLNLKKFYNWRSRLRKLGIFDQEKQIETQQHIEDPFQQVKIEAVTSMTNCRIHLPNGIIVECPIEAGMLSGILSQLKEVV